MTMPQWRECDRGTRESLPAGCPTDDEELSEGQVDVEHHEGEGELAQVVLFSLAQDRLEGLGLGQRNGNDDGERSTE